MSAIRPCENQVEDVSVCIEVTLHLQALLLDPAVLLVILTNRRKLLV